VDLRVRWAAIIVAIVGLAGQARAQFISPGPLTAAHASIDNDSSCDKCHQSGKRVVASLCLDCHKDLASELAVSRGLHGKQYKAKPCEECHVEHLGRGSKLVRWPGGAMDRLDHRLTGWALDGEHTKAKCLDCHKKTSPLGKPQFLGTSTACGSCHNDPHAGRFGSDCLKCHGVVDWKGFDRSAFDHGLTKYPLTGKHKTVGCEQCHAGTPPKWKPLAFATCDSCHADPHAGQFKPKACSSCHTTDSWDVADDKIRQSHPKLSLANGHARVKCEACHDRGNDKPPSKGSRCESCHRPIHLAKFGNRCESCHAAIRWVGLPEAVGRDHHPKTRYPLAGKHAAVECIACHPKSKPQAARFRNLAFGACKACHADTHKGELAQRAGGECAQCHTVAGFWPTTFGVKAHATAKLALDGKHVATPCGACHTGPRPRLSFVVGKAECLDCHENPHGTQFAKEMAQGGCAACHTTADWHQSKIDHSIWPLVGEHARTKCAGCHGEQKKGAEPAAYRGIPRECEGCHDDTHAGQFQQTQPAKACKSCHDPTTFAIAATFRHDTTGFPLAGKHAPLACDRCHAPASLRDGSTAVRWRLGYRRCKDCHANPHREGP
jgi:hypothetical protein